MSHALWGSFFNLLLMIFPLASALAAETDSNVLCAEVFSTDPLLLVSPTAPTRISVVAKRVPKKLSEDIQLARIATFFEASLSVSDPLTLVDQTLKVAKTRLSAENFAKLLVFLVVKFPNLNDDEPGVFAKNQLSFFNLIRSAAKAKKLSSQQKGEIQLAMAEKFDLANAGDDEIDDFSNFINQDWESSYLWKAQGEISDESVRAKKIVLRRLLENPIGRVSSISYFFNRSFLEPTGLSTDRKLLVLFEELPNLFFLELKGDGIFNSLRFDFGTNDLGDLDSFLKKIEKFIEGALKETSEPTSERAERLDQINVMIDEISKQLAKPSMPELTKSLNPPPEP